MTRNETPPSSRPPRRETSRDETKAAPANAGPSPAETGKPGRQRIAKAMARAGLCSRRDAEAWVLAGRVAVNGEVLTSPARDIGPDDTILVDGQPLPSAEKTRLFLFHKPRGLVTSDHDPEGRETVADFLRENWPEGPRTVTIGRLDINTEGLLLLTNDGGLARMLELPESGWLRRYRVRAKGTTDQATLDALAAGIELDGIDYAGIEAKLDRIQGSNCWLTMGLREGKNREIKRVLEHIGLEVNRLIRLSFGPFQLLDLPEGAVEEVRTRVLRDQLGESLARAAGVDFGEASERPNEAALALPGSGGGRPRARPLPAGFAPSRHRDDSVAAEPSRERQDRPGGPRRHVSALRASDAATLDGPRRRIERTKTKDRHDRPVAVERVTTIEPSRTMTKKHASPSAEGKRARMARSGGEGDRGRFEGRDGYRNKDADKGGERRAGPRRGPSEDRRSSEGAGSERTGRSSEGPRRSPAPRGEGGRPSRHERADGGGERPARKPAGTGSRFAKGPTANRSSGGARSGRGSAARNDGPAPNRDKPWGSRPGKRPSGGTGRPPPRRPGGGRSKPPR